MSKSSTQFFLIQRGQHFLLCLSPCNALFVRTAGSRHLGGHTVRTMPAAPISLIRFDANRQRNGGDRLLIFIHTNQVKTVHFKIIQILQMRQSWQSWDSRKGCWTIVRHVEFLRTRVFVCHAFNLSS